MRTIFFTTAYTRKPEFQLETLAILKDGAPVFMKRATSENSLEFLKTIKKNYNKLSELEDAELHFSKILNFSSQDRSLQFEYIKGSSLEKLLLDATLNDDGSGQIQIIEKLENILRKLSTTTEPLHNHCYDQEAFGPNLFETFKDSACIHTGLLDCNFDNVLADGNKLSLIDYEWCFDHCLPYDYVLARALMWFSKRHSTQLKLNAERLKLVGISDDLVFTEAVYNQYSSQIKQIKQALEIEWTYFQKWVTGFSLEDNIPQFKVNRSIERPVLALEELDAKRVWLDGLIKERDRLAVIAGDRQKTVEELSSELHLIKNSKSYRAAAKLRRAKNKVLPRD